MLHLPLQQYVKQSVFSLSSSLLWLSVIDWFLSPGHKQLSGECQVNRSYRGKIEENIFAFKVYFSILLR